MGLFQFDEGFDSQESQEWESLLKYILNKKTHEKDFQDLFTAILGNSKHEYYRQARTLKMLYDFTPLRRREVEPGEAATR